MRNRITTLVLLALIIPIIVLLLLDLWLGSVYIPVDHFFDILTGRSDNTGWNYIVFYLRLPRAITAIITGAGLSVAGLMMQTLFRNPLAGPFVLGISSGASLGVAVFVMSSSVVTFFNIEIGYFFGAGGQVVASIFGSSLVFLLIIAFSSKVRDTISLLIIGIMFGSLATAIVSILQYFSEPELVQKFVIWTLGSLSSTGWEQLGLMIPLVCSGFVVAVFLIKPMNALLLGEENARATGVRIKRIKYLILISSSLITGSLVAFTGPIAFIGLSVPHIVRLLFGTSNHRIVLPGSILLGAMLVTICDILSQIPGHSMVLPINAITALFGAPVVIWIIIGRKNRKIAF
ncbi:MAG: iron ABC transporter permease [Bacteroidales bacterium]|nr:iron ABC transporter permease [Bacteroidales bacterium]